MYMYNADQHVICLCLETGTVYTLNMLILCICGKIPLCQLFDYQIIDMGHSIYKVKETDMRQVYTETEKQIRDKDTDVQVYKETEKQI